MSLNYVTVTGTFEDGTGQPLSGNVTFTANQLVYASGVPVVGPNTPVTAEVAGGQLLNASGGALQLLATDNAGLSLASGTGFWYWTVALQFGQVTDGWSFFLPHTPSPVDLYSLKNTSALGGALAAKPGSTSVPAGDLSPQVVPLIDAATILVDADDGNDFYVTLGGNRTMGAPGNPSDGQKITFEIIQDGTGSRTLTWTSGAGGYSFGSGSAPTLSTAAGATDQAAFRYSARKNAWLTLGSDGGF